MQATQTEETECNNGVEQYQRSETHRRWEETKAASARLKRDEDASDRVKGR